MKVVGLNLLKTKKKRKRCFVICVGRIFEKCVVIGSVVLFMMVLNLISKTFLSNVSLTLQQFVEFFIKVG